MQRIASSSAKTFESFLIERLASDAARSSSETASTEPMRGSRGSSGNSKPVGSAGACATQLSVVPGRLQTRERLPLRCLHEPTL